jgi:hypothetical protein
METFGMEVPEIKGTKLFKDYSKRYLIAFCNNCSTNEIFEQTSDVPYTKHPQIPCENCNVSMMDIIGWEQENENL